MSRRNICQRSQRTRRPARAGFPRRPTWRYKHRGAVYLSAYGISPALEQAFLRIADEVHSHYRALFGQHVLERVEVNVSLKPSLEHRLWTNGADRIYLTLNHARQLNVPVFTGVFNVHGIAHELAHMVMYRSLVNISQLARGWGEGWAVYLASFIAVPHLHARCGDGLWPAPYDYVHLDGPNRYVMLLQGDDSADDPTLRVVRVLNAMDQSLGRERFAGVLRSLVRKPRTAEEFDRMMASKLRDVARRSCRDADQRRILSAEAKLLSRRRATAA